jgi:exosortase
MTERTASPVRTIAWLLAAALGGFTLWAFWPPLNEMAARWSSDPQYSHGYLVPIFSAFLLWWRRDRLASVGWSPSWWGLLPLAAAALLRYEASRNYDYFDGLALILTVAAFVLLVGGVQALNWAWPSVAFLLFMVPLPYSVEHAASGPLQSVATKITTYIMQTIGLPALSEGNIIVLGNGNIEVERACSGLSMLVIFTFICTAMAVLIRRPLLDKIVILVSAAPIAVIANVARITATGLAQEWFGAEAAHKIFHDWAGWLMMPFALVLLWMLLGLLSLLFREAKETEKQDGPVLFDRPGGPATARDPRGIQKGPREGSAKGIRGVPPVGPAPVGATGG